MKWWQEKAIYEVYPKSFLDTTGSGSGDIRGIIAKLDHLQSLDIGGIWLTPVCVSPMADNGYDIADYRNIDPSFGTMEDMDELIRRAGEMGMKIIIDLVFNHTSDRHPWFLESRRSKDGPKSSWYIWRDAKADGGPPTNWRGIFGGSAWEWCPERGQYYLHTFAASQPDLNWAEPEVRRELREIADFWLDKGAAGFRLDAITYIRKPDSFEDGKPDGADGMVSVHEMTVNRKGILEYLHEFRDHFSGRDTVLIGEANGVSAEELPAWVGPAGVFDMLFEFSHVNLDFKGVEMWCRPVKWKAADLKKALFDSQKATEDGWYPVFFENHDKPRSVSHYFPANTPREKAARVILTLLYTLRGTPFLYQGQEIGMRNVAWDSLDQYDELNTRAQYEFALQEGFSSEEAMASVHRFSRDNARTPMQWNDSGHAGFTAGTPWLAVNEDYTDINVRDESADPDSILSFCRFLARLRRDCPVFTEGSFTPLFEEDSRIFAYRRTGDETEAAVLVNFSGRSAKYDAGAIPEEDYVQASAHEHVPGVLRPWETVILMKKED